MIVAVDTGGTKTLVAIFDTDGQVIRDEKFPTPTDLEEYIRTLTSTIDRLLSGDDPTCISVALPGSIRDGVMIWAGNLSWRGTDMRTLIGNHYACPIIVENDANLAGLAEARALPEVPAVCLYLTVSTGIGTGVTLDGKLHPLLNRTEGGHMVFNHNGTLSTWESYASGKAILRDYGKLASEIDDEATWRTIADNIAQGLLAICPFLQPDVVVIGGGVGAHFDTFRPFLLESVQAHLPEAYHPQITQALHPETAVIYGCYYYALDSAAA